MCDANVEITLTRLKNQKVAKRFIKLVNTSLTPEMTSDDYSKNPRRVHPLTKIASREIIEATCNYMTSIIKSSNLFVDVAKLCMKHNNLGGKRSAQRIQEKEAENINLSVSEEETYDNNNNLPITTQDIQMKGVLEDVTNNPLLNPFKVSQG